MMVKTHFFHDPDDRDFYRDDDKSDDDDDDGRDDGGEAKSITVLVLYLMVSKSAVWLKA